MEHHNISIGFEGGGSETRLRNQVKQRYCTIIRTVEASVHLNPRDPLYYKIYLKISMAAECAEEETAVNYLPQATIEHIGALTKPRVPSPQGGNPPTRFDIMDQYFDSAPLLSEWEIGDGEHFRSVRKIPCYDLKCLTSTGLWPCSNFLVRTWIPPNPVLAHIRITPETRLFEGMPNFALALVTGATPSEVEAAIVPHQKGLHGEPHDELGFGPHDRDGMPNCSTIAKMGCCFKPSEV